MKIVLSVPNAIQVITCLLKTVQFVPMVAKPAHQTLFACPVVKDTTYQGHRVLTAMSLVTV